MILIPLCSAPLLYAQSPHLVTGEQTIDSLKNELARTENDTLRLVLFSQLRYNYFFVNTDMDSILLYSKLFLQTAQKLSYKIDEAYGWDLVADVMNFQQNAHTLETFFKGVKIAEEPDA